MMSIDPNAQGSLSEPRIALRAEVTDAIEAYERVPRKDKLLTTWYAMCIAGQPAAAFFRGPRDSTFHRVTACDLAASAYLDLSAQKEVEIISPSFVLKVREHASSMHRLLPEPQHLPAPADTQEFRTGLESLTRWRVPVTAPTSRSGDPSIRAVTLGLARRFADAFVDIPVEFIHSLVLIGWPARSQSATRRVLTSGVTSRIKFESQEALKREQLAHGATAVALHVASSKAARGAALSEADQRIIEGLESEVARIRQGSRRFPNDAARLRAVLDIAHTVDDPILADDLSRLVAQALQEFEP
jgi:hypothetical protein